LRNHRNRQRKLALQTPQLSATPACPGGQTGTSHARRSVAREGTARRARDPPVRYRDKPARRPVRGPFSMPIRGPDCLPFDSWRNSATSSSARLRGSNGVWSWPRQVRMETWSGSRLANVRLRAGRALASSRFATPSYATASSGEFV
jgi:hypothetical protein